LVRSRRDLPSQSALATTRQCFSRPIKLVKQTFNGRKIAVTFKYDHQPRFRSSSDLLQQPVNRIGHIVKMIVEHTTNVTFPYPLAAGQVYPAHTT
jgi:hypothetical protein